MSRRAAGGREQGHRADTADMQTAGQHQATSSRTVQTAMHDQRMTTSNAHRMYAQHAVSSTGHGSAIHAGQCMRQQYQ
jgi:hypothetical protein